VLIHGATDNDIYPPLFGASQRSFGLFRGLARRHEVAVLCVVPNRTAAPGEQRVASVTLIRRRAWYTSLAWRLQRAGLAPLFLAAHGHALGAAGLRRALPGEADACMADLHLAGLLGRRPARLRVLHAHNVEYDHFRFAGPSVAARGFWAARLRAMESRAVARADLVVAASDEDAARLRALYGVAAPSLAVIPNGYDETAVHPPDPEERARARAALGIGGGDYVCLFVGSDVPHNRAALGLALEGLGPALAADGFRLLVVGSVSRGLAGRRERWLVARPAVPDLLPFLHAADAGLNPATTGGGSNVKLPTYLAAGLAVVTTRFGARGYAALEPHVTIAEPDCLPDALRARPRGWSASGLARPAALDAYAWGRLGERLGEIFEAALAARGAAAVPRAAAGAGA
jgi:glycosyltransferase involved in cell wall biosynthesis